MKLCDMKERQSGVISGIEGTPQFKRRLYDLGFVKGQSVRCENVAILKTPVSFCVQGAKIALRKSDAMRIDVIV